MIWLPSAVGTSTLLLLATLTWMITPEARSRIHRVTPQALPSEDTAVQNTALPVGRSNLKSDVFYEAITQRPLFAPNRRPATSNEPMAEQVAEPDPEPVTATSEHIAAPEISLHGIMRNGTVRHAFLSVSSQEPAWVALNTEISGWRLETIENNWIELVRQDHKHRVELYK